MLRGGVEGINPGISLERHVMDPTVSSFAFGYVTSWLLSSFQPRALRWSPGVCSCSIYQHAYADCFDYISPKQG